MASTFASETLYIPKQPPRCLRKFIWCYQDADFNKACELLIEINWEALVNINDHTGVDISWDNWYSYFSLVMEKCIPKKNIAYRSLPPWINQDILKAIRRRNLLFSSYKKSGCVIKLVEWIGSQLNQSVVLWNSCVPKQVYEFIMQLDNQKSCGTDNVSARMLKATVDTTVSTVTKCLSEREDSPLAGKQQG